MKFKVFNNGKLVDNFDLSGSYLFGSDGIVIRRAKIKFKNGLIECEKPGKETAGLVLMWPIEGFGKVLLPTTCLPLRDKPYVLNVELARAKLMQITNKKEDWSFFGSSNISENISREGQDLFIKAIQNLSNPSAASELADKALKKAVVFSENFAGKQSQLLFELRNKNRGFGRGCLGCVVDLTQIDNPKYVQTLTEQFGLINIPMNWAQIEANKGDYDFSAVDACIEVLKKKKVAISAGPLLCFSEDYLPEWLLNGRGGFGRIRDKAYEFVCEVAARYSGQIRAWRVISGLNVFNHFGFSFEQVIEITRAANMAVKAATNRCVKIIEITNPWGEYYAQIPDTIPALVYMDMIIQSGIDFDVFGLQMQFGANQVGMHIRDMMHISAMLDRFGPIAKPLYITEVEVPSKASVLDKANSAGVWHRQWDQDCQAQWLGQFYRIALSKPFIDNVTYGSLVDSQNSKISNGGLLSEKLEPKKSFLTLKKLNQNIFGK